MKPDLNRYEDPWTAEVYDYHTQGRGNDLPFWLALAREAGAEVLELACGTGRVLIPLAKAGFRVTGLDISAPMLSVARRKLSQEGSEVAGRVTVVRGDMRRFSLERQFGSIFIPYSAFQTLLERADQRACLECCAAHLASDGRLAIDVFHPKLSRLTAEVPVQEGPNEFPGPDDETVRWCGQTEYDIPNQRLRSRWRYERVSSAEDITVSEHLLELRYFFRFEMEWMLEACGFEIEALYGDFERGPLTAESPEMIFVARRAS